MDQKDNTYYNMRAQYEKYDSKLAEIYGQDIFVLHNYLLQCLIDNGRIDDQNFIINQTGGTAACLLISCLQILGQNINPDILELSISFIQWLLYQNEFEHNIVNIILKYLVNYLEKPVVINNILIPDIQTRILNSQYCCPTIISIMIDIMNSSNLSEQHELFVFSNFQFICSPNFTNNPEILIKSDLIDLLFILGSKCGYNVLEPIIQSFQILIISINSDNDPKQVIQKINNVIIKFKNYSCVPFFNKLFNDECYSVHIMEQLSQIQPPYSYILAINFINTLLNVSFEEFYYDNALVIASEFFKNNSINENFIQCLEPIFIDPDTFSSFININIVLHKEMGECLILNEPYYNSIFKIILTTECFNDDLPQFESIFSTFIDFLTLMIENEIILDYSSLFGILSTKIIPFIKQTGYDVVYVYEVITMIETLLEFSKQQFNQEFAIGLYQFIFQQDQFPILNIPQVFMYYPNKFLDIHMMFNPNIIIANEFIKNVMEKFIELFTTQQPPLPPLFTHMNNFVGHIFSKYDYNNTCLVGFLGHKDVIDLIQQRYSAEFTADKTDEITDDIYLNYKYDLVISMLDFDNILFNINITDGNDGNINIGEELFKLLLSPVNDNPLIITQIDKLIVNGISLDSIYPIIIRLIDIIHDHYHDETSMQFVLSLGKTYGQKFIEFNQLQLCLDLCNLINTTFIGIISITPPQSE